MVRRRLKEVGFDPRTFAEVPWLLSHHKVDRLQFAQTHADWDEHQWRNVLFPTSLMKMILGCPESSERFLEK
jgi:hypothetical protein